MRLRYDKVQSATVLLPELGRGDGEKPTLSNFKQGCNFFSFCFSRSNAPVVLNVIPPVRIYGISQKIYLWKSLFCRRTAINIPIGN